MKKKVSKAAKIGVIAIGGVALLSLAFQCGEGYGKGLLIGDLIRRCENGDPFPTVVSCRDNAEFIYEIKAECIGD